jgi:hypothetical protein
MHLLPAFVALLAITPALCAPTPAPPEDTVESLAASAKVSSHSLVVTRMIRCNSYFVSRLGQTSGACQEASTHS